MIKFKELMNMMVVESLHPELQTIVKDPTGYKSKQTQIASKLRDLSKRGESTGLEGNTPKGSSRLWMTHDKKESVKIDGEDSHMKVGTKVAITSSLDKHHKGEESLGEMQNRVENGDYYVDRHHRTLAETDDSREGDRKYETNHDGIFPPKVDHDHEHHRWSVVGHTHDLKSGDFQRLSKTESHPKGISHKDFCDALEREHNKRNGRHWGSSARDAHLDHISEHPLVQNFNDFHGNFASPPTDYRQKKNMGVWKHPVTGKEHIVARDHGFDSEVANAYAKARKASYSR